MPKTKGTSQKDKRDSGLRTVYLALGSNIPPRKYYMLESIKALHKWNPDRFRVSKCYVTRPYMGLDQAAYFNCCVSFQTGVSGIELLHTIKQIEDNLGRKREAVKWGVRSIDIDILFMGSDIIDIPDLTVPHYDVSNRDFFLMPMLDLDKTFVNPRTKMLLSEEIEKIPQNSRTYPKAIRTTKLCELNN